MIFMPIGKQLKRNLETSNLGKLKHKKSQENLRKFQQNHREQEYKAYQRELEAMVQN